MILNFIKIMCYLGYGVGIIFLILYGISYLRVRKQAEEIKKQEDEED